MSQKITKILAALGVTAAVLVGVPLALGVVADTAEADVAVNNFAVPDQTAEAQEVNTVSMFWAGGVSWADTPAPVETVDITVHAESPSGEMQELLTVTCTSEDPPEECGFPAATEESNYLELEAGLITHGDWTSADFEPSPGGEVSHTIEVMIETEVTWDGGSATESASDTMTVTVTHPEEGGNTTTPDDSQETNPDVVVDFGTATVTVA